MKKEQKRLANKGFSLVELIVVIAIMAILIAVLAPTLIGKIEDSREGTDLQAIGEIKTQVTNILGTEKIYNELVPSPDASGNETYVVYTMDDTCKLSGAAEKTNATKELQDVLEKIEWKSKAAKTSGATTRVFITSKGKVYVERSTTEGTPITITDGDDDLSSGTKPSGTKGSEPAQPTS